MKAIETIANVNNLGQLILEPGLSIPNTRVKVIILIPEDNDISDEEWMKSIATNPVFEYLKDPKEDIYTVNDGNPIGYKI